METTQNAARGAKERNGTGGWKQSSAVGHLPKCTRLWVQALASPTKTREGATEVAWSVKCLPGKHEDLNLDSSAPT